MNETRPLWSWGSDEDGNVTIRVVAPVALELRVSRRDVERMEAAGTPQMREVYRRMRKLRESA